MEQVIPATLNISMRIAYNEYIYESVILEGYTSADILRLYGNKLKEQIANEKNEDVENIQDAEVNQLIQHIEQADPSSDKKWLGSIATWLLGKRLEDLDAQIKPNLVAFKDLLESNPGKYGTVSKNIAKGKITYDTLKDIIQSNNVISKEDSNIAKKVGDFKKISEDTNYVMYFIDKWTPGEGDKHICFSGNVDWCVKYKNYFDNYEPPYYYILSKINGKEYALMHLNSMQLKNIKDNPLSLDEFSRIANIVLPIVEQYLANNNAELKGDFSVIDKYLSEHLDVRVKYPITTEATKANKITTMFRLQMWDDLLDFELEGKGLNYTRVSSKIMHHLITDKAIPGRLIEAIVANPTFDVNALVLGKHSLILAAKSKNKLLVDLLLNNPRFTYTTLNTDGYNLFNGIYGYYHAMEKGMVEYIGSHILAKMPAEIFQDNTELPHDENNHQNACELICNRALVQCFSVFIKRGFTPYPDWISMIESIIAGISINRISEDSQTMLKLIVDHVEFDWKTIGDDGQTVAQYIESLEFETTKNIARRIIGAKLT